MAVTMRDVASHAGVSQRTVSNVVTGSVPVAPRTRARVEASIKALGYRTFGPAQQLRHGKTSTIALAVPDLTEPYFAELAQRVIDHARISDLRVMVLTTEGNREAELALLSGRNVSADGLILSAVGLTSQDREVRHPRFAAVLVGDRGVGEAITHVGPDNRAASALAVAHLIDAGRRRIALIGADSGPATTRKLRTAGYRDAHQLADIPIVPELQIVADWTFEAAREAVAELLTTPAVADAIFALNDSSALGAMQAVISAGRRVPDDVAVVGFDNTVQAGRSAPGLTSVGPMPDDVAAVAVNMLTRQLAGDDEAIEVVVPHRLIARGSTGAALAGQTATPN